MPSENTGDVRSNVADLNRYARQLYEQGASASEVLRRVYGVDLPSEVYAFHRARAGGLELPVQELMHPWELVSLEDPRREVADVDPWSREQEEGAFMLSPDFLPLMDLPLHDATHGEQIIGYSIEALRRGETSIFGYQGEFGDGGSRDLKLVGPSLLQVLHEWLADHLRMVRAQVSAPTNFGFGALSAKDVDRAEQFVSAVEGIESQKR